MKLDDLAPTLRRALRDAYSEPLSRVRGGYSNTHCIDDPHTVRCVNALERNRCVDYTQLRSAAFITARGRELIEAADKQTSTPSSIAA